MALTDFLRSVTPYKLYVLLLCLLAFLLNQLDRYLLPVMSLHIAHDLHYGDKACIDSPHLNKSVNNSDSLCNKIVTQVECDSQFYFHDNRSVCVWDYNGQGLDYQIIAGPVFIVVYTFCGIFLSYLATYFKRKNLLTFFLLLWSVFTVLSGLCKSYWQLALARFGLGISEAGCTPFAASIIGDMFPQEVRGSALGIYNFGIYFGYSMSYAFGNFLYEANILHQGWRWVFYISGMLGVPVAALIFLTIRERWNAPFASGAGERSPLIRDEQDESPPSEGWKEKLRELITAFLSPPVLMLCIAGSIRNAGGYVWGQNTQLFYQSQHQTSQQIGSYMSWIPLVGGSFGAFFGGFISDRVVKKRGIPARMAVLVLSQLCAAPFALMALLLKPPAAYLMLIPSNIIGEMWIGVCLTCLLEMVPERIRAASVGYYLFIITNIGGNIPLLVPVFKHLFAKADPSTALRNSLIVLFPGLYVVSSALFVLAILVYVGWQRRRASSATIYLSADD